jgi:hypothetical protein
MAYMLKAVLVVFLMTSLAIPALAAAKSEDCRDLAENLKNLQKAQQSISESLASNHETFANLLEDYSSALNMSAGMGKPVTHEAVTKMGESAKAFRERGQNAQKLNKKLTEAWSKLIAQAGTCLNK